MRELSRGRNDDSRARPQIQIVVVEKESGREVIEYFERLIAAGRKLQVSVAVIADRRIERPISGYGKDLIAQTCGKSSSPNRVLSAGSTTVSRYSRRRIEDRDLLLNVECVVPQNPAIIGRADSARRLVINRAKRDVYHSIRVQQR